jgi:hypothetical protein
MKITHGIVASIATMLFLAACGTEVVVAPPPVAVPAAPAEVTPSEFQPCKAVTDCRGAPNPVVGPCQEGRKSESRWSCIGDRCVPVAECN